MNTSAAVFLSGMMSCGALSAAQQPQSPLVVQVTVNGNALPARDTYRFPSDVKQLRFYIQGELNGIQSRAGRVRFKLEGYETDWREQTVAMNLRVRFADRDGNALSQ